MAVKLIVIDESKGAHRAAVAGDAAILDGDLHLPSIKSGATQVAAGAVADEVWKTLGHATLPDNVLMVGV